MRKQDWDQIVGETDPDDVIRWFKSMIEGGGCVHSFFVQNCSGCRERELMRALAVLVDFYEGKQSSSPRGTVIEDITHAWKFAKQVLQWCDVDQHYPEYQEYVHTEGDTYHLMAGPEGLPPALGCDLPPAGWYCSREPGHEGPCAAYPLLDSLQEV